MKLEKGHRWKGMGGGLSRIVGEMGVHLGVAQGRGGVEEVGVRGGGGELGCYLKLENSLFILLGCNLPNF